MKRFITKIENVLIHQKGTIHALSHLKLFYLPYTKKLLSSRDLKSQHFHFVMHLLIAKFHFTLNNLKLE